MELTEKNYFLLKEQKLTRAKIAEKFQIPEWKLKKEIAKNGWGKSKPLILNPTAFSEKTEACLYWAGFIAADGCITKETETLKICLHYDDTNHLEKFKEFVGSEHTISSNTDKYYRSEIGFKNKRITEDLKTYFNITPVKSLTYQMPSLEKEQVRHFLRGYFDGDGCICESFSNKASKTATLYTTVTGSNDFIGSLSALLQNLLSIEGSVQLKDKVSVIKYNTRKSIVLLDFLYRDSSIYLDRKYALYHNIVVKNLRKMKV